MHPRCKDLIADFEQVLWKSDPHGNTLSKLDQSNPKRTHVSDATVGDALYAGQRQRTRILQRTAQGVDVDGRKFAPYSENGPYYYNPNGRLSAASREKVSDKTQKGAARRLLNKITTKEQRASDNAPALSRTGRTIRCGSYAALDEVSLKFY